MATSFEELVVANHTYHVAVDNVFTIATSEIPIDELAEVKAKFGAFHNNIFLLMKEAQTLLEPYFESGE